MKKIHGFLAACLLMINSNVYAAEDDYVVELPADIVPQDTNEGVVDSFEAAVSGVKVLLPYAENKIYQLYCQEGFLTDLMMAPGEEITSIAGADSERWIITNIAAGNLIKRQHVMIKPVQRGLETNLIITTTQHVYHLHLRSGSFHNPIVEWLYPNNFDSFGDITQAKNYLAFNPEKLNFGYEFNKKKEHWAPEQVFGDGKKTYIRMKEEMFNYKAPSFFVVDDGKLILANHRLVKGYFIIDRLFDEARLVLGKEKITIKRS